MRTRLELHLTLDAGREVECARFLHAELQPPQWAILAALAAELVQEHESRVAGSRVLVVEPAAAERVVRELERAPR